MSANQTNFKSNRSRVSLLDFENLNACIELDEIALNGLWNKEQWQKELTDPGRICLGVFKGSILVGISCGWLILDELHITAIAIHPNFRREGLARLLLLTMLEKAKSRGIYIASLEVSSENLAAQELYRSCGFISAGLRRKYYKDGSDAIIQWQKLCDQRK